SYADVYNEGVDLCYEGKLLYDLGYVYFHADEYELAALEFAKSSNKFELAEMKFRVAMNLTTDEDERAAANNARLNCQYLKLGTRSMMDASLHFYDKKYQEASEEIKQANEYFNKSANYGN
ncbi:unnamed protein product, partial [marine sediment metagenome]